MTDTERKLINILCDYDVWFEDVEDMASEIMELFKNGV